MKTFKELYEACCAACEKRDEMEESDSGLAAKAEKSGVSVGTLRKVYKRGVAAWNSGHRPGTTPQQWGMARVNSYITKGKGTYHGADKDLREEEVEIDEDDLSVRTLYNKYADRTANAKNTKPVEKAIKKVHGSKVLSHMKKAASANIDTKFDKEKQHFDKARKAAGNTDMIGATVGKNRSAFRKQYEEVAKDKESGLPKKYVSGLSPSTAKARAAHWEKMDKLSDKDPAAYEPAPGDATAKTRESKHTIKARKMFGEACWDGYKKVGMKKKGDKMVPNCVPEESQKGKNVVPPTAGTIGSIGGLVREEENENKPLGKVMRAGDGKKKFKVFVKNSKGNTVKVGFGDPNMEIKRDDPERRKNFRARHNCATAKDRTTPRYWSCRQWRSSSKVEA